MQFFACRSHVLFLAKSLNIELPQVKDNTGHIGDYDALQLRNIVVRLSSLMHSIFPVTTEQGFFIFIGAIWHLTSVILIVGVRKRSQPLLCCFVITLLIMFVVEIAVGIAAAVVLKVILNHLPTHPCALAHTHTRKKPRIYRSSF
jgi:hypothetical protein